MSRYIIELPNKVKIDVDKHKGEMAMGVFVGEVVMCKECKYDGTWKCPWRNTQVPRYPSADDFCSYAERSEHGKDIQSTDE